ncbi:MAG: hypothetical protein M3Q45_00540 [Chloroflexota bacterium]|nr:hypothetical protein [Chloroflexota bacterium]
MALLTVEIPERLLAKLKRTGRPAQEVVVEALEQTLARSLPATDEQPAREELVKRLVDAGLVRDPEEYDSPDVREWLALPEAERQKIVAEIQAIWFPDSFASQTIIQDRR